MIFFGDFILEKFVKSQLTFIDNFHKVFSRNYYWIDKFLFQAKFDAKTKRRAFIIILEQILEIVTM